MTTQNLILTREELEERLEKPRIERVRVRLRQWRDYDEERLNFKLKTASSDEEMAADIIYNNNRKRLFIPDATVSDSQILGVLRRVDEERRRILLYDEKYYIGEDGKKYKTHEALVRANEEYWEDYRKSFIGMKQKFYK